MCAASKLFMIANENEGTYVKLFKICIFECLQKLKEPIRLKLNLKLKTKWQYSKSIQYESDIEMKRYFFITAKCVPKRRQN